MVKKNFQKIKLLKLYDILKQETDEGHPLTTKQLTGRLEELGISCDRRTLSKDVDVLNDYNYEVMSTMVGHEKGYYVADRNFSDAELKILIDAVQAATFITENKAFELITKISNLSSEHRADILKGNMVVFNTIKHTNESIFYNVEYLNEALHDQKKASFQYYDLDENARKVYRKDKKRYIVEPVALIYNSDNYYLMTYSAKYDNIVNYRVDRMDKVEVEDDKVSSEAITQIDNVANNTEQAFKMFAGQTKDVVLKFDDSIIGAVYDKFGEDTRMMRHDENSCLTTVKVQVSPIFYAWVFQFGDCMEVLSPESVRLEYVERAKEVCGE